MRTSVTLADDVAAAVAERRRARGTGVSEAINELVREGLTPTPVPEPFVQHTHALGVPRVDLTNVAETLALVEGDAHH